MEKNYPAIINFGKTVELRELLVKMTQVRKNSWTNRSS